MFRNIYYKSYKDYLKNIKKKSIKYRYLLKGLIRNTGGRNNLGKITSYHRGGGVKSLCRRVNFDYINLYKKNLIK
jgi:ribosomal protein L2